MDRMEFIAGHAQHPVAVMSNPQHTDLEIMDLDLVTDDIRARFRERGYHFFAVVGTLSGRPQIEMAFPVSPDVLFSIGAAYSRHVETVKSGPDYDFGARRYH